MNHIRFGVAFNCWRTQGLPQARHSRAGGNPALWPTPGLRLVLFLTLLPTSVLSSPHSAFLVSTAYAGDVQYIYDDLGRLSAVVDSTTGEVAIYQYDAVCSLLGIVRQLVSTVAILNFTPKSGPVGATVTISGIGFSATANQNTVAFNGMPTTVSSATATQLVLTVLSSATTGPIAVTTPSGSATSGVPFTFRSAESQVHRRYRQIPSTLRGTISTSMRRSLIIQLAASIYSGCRAGAL